MIRTLLRAVFWTSAFCTVSSTISAQLPPMLTYPFEGAVLDNGCLNRIDTIAWDFAWTSVARASKYELYVFHVGSQYPVIDNSNVYDTSYHYVSAGSYIADGNRTNWTWRVRALVDSVWTPWSETRGFEVELLDTDCSGNPSGRKILVDASKDGGGWWFPQSGIFDEDQWHQGKALADYIRSRGFQVDELGRGTVVTDSLLDSYDIVIGVDQYFTYSLTELQAYDSYLNRAKTLLLFSDYLMPGQKDQLAERLGIPLVGSANGDVSVFASDPITDGVFSFSYAAGSAVADTTANPEIRYLGWLDQSDFVDLNNNSTRDTGEPSGVPVMGVLNHQLSRVFFIGDVNCMERIPQPLTDNLLNWAQNEYTTVNETLAGLLPSNVELEQNYPNPFNPTTSIGYNVPIRTQVNLEVFNLLGQHVKTLVNVTESAGRHVIEWDGTDAGGRTVASGVYLYRLQAADFVETKKMVLLK